jgi:hypothetical protein
MKKPSKIEGLQRFVLLCFVVLFANTEISKYIT